MIWVAVGSRRRKEGDAQTKAFQSCGNIPIRCSFTERAGGGIAYVAGVFFFILGEKVRRGGGTVPANHHCRLLDASIDDSKSLSTLQTVGCQATLETLDGIGSPVSIPSILLWKPPCSMFVEEISVVSHRSTVCHLSTHRLFHSVLSTALLGKRVFYRFKWLM